MPSSSIRTARFNQSCIVDNAATAAADARMSSQPEVNRLQKKKDYVCSASHMMCCAIEGELKSRSRQGI